MTRRRSHVKRLRDLTPVGMELVKLLLLRSNILRTHRVAASAHETQWGTSINSATSALAASALALADAVYW